MHLFPFSNEETNQNTESQTRCPSESEGGPWRLSYVLGNHSNAHGWEPPMDASLQCSLDAEAPCTPRTRTVLPLERLTTRAPESPKGFILGPGSLVGLKHLHSNRSNKLSTVLPAEAPGSWTMGVPVNSKFHHGSQGHMSAGTGPRTTGSKGIQL